MTIQNGKQLAMWGVIIGIVAALMSWTANTVTWSIRFGGLVQDARAGPAALAMAQDNRIAIGEIRVELRRLPRIEEKLDQILFGRNTLTRNPE